jgi:carbonic anhydrase
MSIYSSSTSWGGQCASNSGTQSPINLSQSTAKPCDLLCDLVVDDVFIPTANVVVSNEGLLIQNTAGLGSCKFNGEGYTCQSVLINHPSHHTIENIQADAEAIVIYTNPTGKYLCVSSLIRVSPAESSSSSFFNAIIPYANPNVPYTQVSLGDSWTTGMLIPPNGSYYVYEGSLVAPPCQPVQWVVFKSFVGMSATDFAILVKNVQVGSRSIQPSNGRDVFFNDTEHVQGAPAGAGAGRKMIRCKRASRPSVKISQPDAKAHAKANAKTSYLKNVSSYVSETGIIALLDVILLCVSLYFGIYYGWKTSQGPYGFYLLTKAEQLAGFFRNLAIKKPPSVVM